MADKVLAGELVSYSKQDKLLEWQRLIPWINNFAQKKAKGIFDKAKAEKALADYLFKDAYGRYLGKGMFAKGLPRVDADTKLLYGKKMLVVLMPKINKTVQRMRKVGLNKGKLVKPHPGMKR